ncbi:uncharacterized protein TM35_000031560 [Trypanosoma theileri]|uniref:Mucin TcMUCII n=1 Tax=Trypanosoma theileri TaxID=67003 RepID=A0A1X0P6Y7_9TRYP|nr:uncharacterized protein TM35_000031560 [Trypanosoma theileri]ORC92403.1 hypothetical protein TM35_000031560 [Trypanosoma theileri]
MVVMCRVMCVLTVVLCCACGYTMAAASTTPTAGQLKAVMAIDHPFFNTHVEEEKIISDFYDKPLVIRDNDSRSLNDVPSRPATGIDPSNSQEQDRRSRPGVSEEMGERTVEGSLQAAVQGPHQAPAKPPSELPQGDQNVVNHGEQRPQITSSSDQANDIQHVNAAVSSSGISAPQVERSTSTNGGGDSAGEHTGTKQSNPPTEGNPGSSNNTGDNSVPGDNNTPQQPSSEGTTAVPGSQENTTTTPPSTENTVSEAPTTTASPVPVPNAEITSIASAVQKNKANADSSVSPVWMRTAAPLLIVVVLFSFTVY